jgi:very-short-patch-repair endonuclease
MISGMTTHMTSATTSATTSLVLVRADLLAANVRRGSIQANLRRQRWVAPYRSIYLDASLDGDVKQEAIRAAHLLRAGPGSALSHHTAAAIHGFDATGIRPHGTWILAPHDARVRCPPELHLTRSRVIGDDDIETVNGVGVTSRARTVLDLAATLDLIELERVIESALRGPDRKRPDRWRTDVFAKLVAFASGDRRRPGASAVARCLATRAGATRPTGSIAETAMIQALRAEGVTDVIRQPTVRILGEDGRSDELFPDIVVPSRRAIVEVDGSEHRDSKRHRADLSRQNKLLRGFELIRCTGADALFDGRRVAKEVASYPVVESVPARH